MPPEHHMAATVNTHVHQYSVSIAGSLVPHFTASHSPLTTYNTDHSLFLQSSTLRQIHNMLSHDFWTMLSISQKDLVITELLELKSRSQQQTMLQVTA